MIKLPHSIRKQTIEVNVDSEAVAMALQPRLADINRRYLLPVIEQVMDELAVSGNRLKVARVDVDLGTLPFDGFETSAAKRLYQELRKALEATLREQDADASPGIASQPEQTARLELLKAYLVGSALPYWAPRNSVLPLEELLDEIINEDPSSVIGLIRRHGTDTNVVERLVLQLDEEFLARLIRLLEPEHAALIIAYVIDLKKVHSIEPIVDLSDPEFSQLLWVLALRYLVHDAGSQFNRKSFVRSLLEGMAQSEGIDYEGILITLRRGLEKTRTRISLRFSLPGIILELVNELDDGNELGNELNNGIAQNSYPPAGKPPALDRSEFKSAELSFDPAGNDQAGLIGTIRDRASRGGEIETTAEAANDGDELIGLIRDHASRGGEIETTAEAAGDGDDSILMIGDHASRGGEIDSTTTTEAENDRDELTGLIRDHASRGEVESTTTEAENDANDSIRMIRHNASRGSEIDRMVAEAGNNRANLIRMIRDRASRSGEIKRIVTEASEADLRYLLVRLDPEHTALIIAYMIDLKEIHRIEHVPPVSEQKYDGLLWMLVLAYEARDPGSQFNRRSFVKSLVEGIAESEGLDYSEFITAMQSGLVETQKKGWIKSSLPGVIGELWGGLHGEIARPQPEQSGELPFLPESAGTAASSYDQFEMIRYYLTYATLPWPALLDEPARTAEAAVTPLLTLSISQLRALFSRPGVDRQRAVLRALEALREEAAPLLIARLLDHTAARSGTFFEALSQFAQQARHKRDFYARTISAILEGGPVDLEGLAVSASEPSSRDPGSTDALVDWQPHLLKSMIAAQLRSADSASPGDPPLADLIHALVARHPQDARHFFYEIRDADALSNALVQQCHPSLFEEVLEFLRPEEVETLNALMRAIASIPAPYRPSSDQDVPQALFRELISLGQQQPLGEAFFIGVIRRLFTTPLSEWMSKFLLREAAAWECGEHSLAEHSSAFERAIRAAGVRANGGSHEEHHVAEDIESSSLQRASSLLDAIFGFLSGKTIVTEDHSGHSAGGRPARDAISSDALIHALLVLLDESPEAVSSFIARAVVDPQTRERWVRILPESVLVRISYLLAPPRHRILMESAEVLASAWIETAPSRHPALTGREELWLFLLEFFSKHHGGGLSLKRLVGALCDHYAARYRAASPSQTDSATVGGRLLERAERLAAISGRTGLLGVLQSDRAGLLESWNRTSEEAQSGASSQRREQRLAAPPPRIASSRRRTKFSFAEDEANVSKGEPIYISNAGLVLSNPFLPHLFRSLDLIEQEESGRLRLRDHQSASRASHLLQYLVDGSGSTPEPLLVLNKILCGAPVGAPIERRIDPTGEEIEVCERLLKSMISNWKIIENSSIAALRETFLQREGRLERSADAWKLRVQRKTVDVLVDQVPWNLAVVYHQWMSKPILVTW